MLWIKAFHIVFVASWFAGLFYLPRLFVNLATVPADSHAERERLLMMARKLYRFSSLLMIPALVLGLVLWLYYGIGRGPGNYWMHAKLLLVVLVIGYHTPVARSCASSSSSPTCAANDGFGSSMSQRCCCLWPSSCWWL